MPGRMYPRSRQVTGVTTTGGAQTLTAGCTKVKISNYGSQILRVFYTEADYTANNTNRNDLPATTGFIVLDPCQQASIWFRAAASTTDFELLEFVESG